MPAAVPASSMRKHLSGLTTTYQSIAVRKNGNTYLITFSETLGRGVLYKGGGVKLLKRELNVNSNACMM